MTRPLALIEGDLALPDASLLHGLPPPFGLRPPPARTTPQRDARREAQLRAQRDAQLDAQLNAQRDAQLNAQRPAAAAAQRAARNAVRHKMPVSRRPLPPDTLFRFFYKARTPRDYSAHFKAQLAEARYYLDADMTRARSSRKDYVLGAAIFVLTGIALAWLLTTSAMRDAEMPGVALIARPVAVQSEQPASQSQSQPAAARAPTVAQNAATASKPTPLAVRPVEHVARPQVARSGKSGSMRQAALADQDLPSSRHIASQSTAKAKTAAPAPDTRPRRLASAGASAGPSASTQPEQTAHAFSADAAPERAALLDWAAQQRRTAAATPSSGAVAPATRASVPATPPTASWSAHMTQRRITENPDAFDANARQP